ncbi:hypothetical protein PAMC26577_16855 [Caballeronia sordidicola]|uniref:Uncharacterized protein n=1 Tax=Caballeronia sordidicola TaxID=196367 RepID=A0A242MS10_CABSO|nr:hypothetical protein PAMC26577_16855 [Caballeronia sordidicola]
MESHAGIIAAGVFRDLMRNTVFRPCIPARPACRARAVQYGFVRPARRGRPLHSEMQR